MDYIGYILGLYWDNGKDNGNYFNGGSSTAAPKLPVCSRSRSAARGQGAGRLLGCSGEGIQGAFQREILKLEPIKRQGVVFRVL